MTVITGLDHVIIAVRDLDAGEAAMSRLGFRPTPRGYHSAHMGTANSTIVLPDNTYFEVLGVVADTGACGPAGPGANPPGDFNCDGVVDVADLGIVGANFDGADVNYVDGDANLDGAGSRMEVNTYSFGAYAGWQSEDCGLFANGGVFGGWSEYNQNRTISIGAINRNAGAAGTSSGLPSMNSIAK